MAEPLLSPRWDEHLRVGASWPDAPRLDCGTVHIAILSDAHGIFAALEAAVGDIDHLGADLVLVGGDMAQGGCRPDQVIDLLMARGWPAVIGNADAFLLDIHDNLIAATPKLESAFVSTRSSLQRLSPAHLDYLRGLPGALRVELPAGRRLALIHATTWSLEDFVAPDADDALRRRLLAEAHADIVVHGHIHTPYHRSLPEGAVVSVGGIGGSNDQDPRPAYALLHIDGDRIDVEVRRVAFDIPAEAAAIRRLQPPGAEQKVAALTRPGPWPVRSKPGRTRIA